MDWTLEECTVTVLLLLFFTHFYIPVLEPVQNSLFAAASDDKTATGQCIALGLWFIAGLLMLRHYRSVLSGARSIAWTTAFAALALVSAAWSQDASVTIRKSVFLLLTTAFGIYFARRYSLDRQLRMICIAACSITLLSAGFALFAPRYGRDHDAHEGVWVGVFTQKNVCAREMLFILVCLLPYRPASRNLRWARYVAIFLTIIVIFGTQSKTAWLIALFALGFFSVVRLMRKLSPGLALTALTGAGIAIAVSIAIAASSAPRLVMLLGRDSTMTGRTEIWQAVLQAIMKRPLLGYGFAAFWLSLRGESANIILALRWAVPAAHNGFLEIWLQLGALGLLLFGVGFLQAVVRCARCFRRESMERAAWPLAVLLLTIVYNLDESSLMQANDFIWIVYIATLVNIANGKRIVSAPELLPTNGHPLRTDPKTVYAAS